DDLLAGRPVEEGLGAGARFGRAAAFGAEDDPPNRQVLVIADQLQQGPAAANLDVVRVGAEAQDVLHVAETELDHGVSVSSGLNPSRNRANARRRRKRRSPATARRSQTPDRCTARRERQSRRTPPTSGSTFPCRRPASDIRARILPERTASAR